MKKWIVGLLVLLMMIGCAAAEEEHTHQYYVDDRIPVKAGWQISTDGSVRYLVAFQGVCHECGDKELIHMQIPDEDVPEGGVQVCPHDVWFRDVLREDDVEWAQQVSEDITGFVSGVCMLCNEDYLFYEGDAAGLTCNGKTHIFQRNPEVLEEGWYPSTAVHGYGATHGYQTYYRAECICGTQVLKCYVHGKTEDGQMQHEHCNLQEIASYHRYEIPSDGGRNEGDTHVTVYKCTDCGNITESEYTCNLYNNFLCAEEMKEAWEFYGFTEYFDMQK